MKRIHIIIISISVAAIALLAAGAYAWRYATAPYQGDDAQWVYIPAGATDEGVRDILTSTLGPDLGPRVYRLWHWQDGTPERAHGAYRIDPLTPAWRIARKIAQGRQTPIDITFSSLRTIDDLIGKIAPSMEFTEDQLREAIDTILPQEGFESPEQYPAAFIPNKHQVYWTEPAEKMVRRLLDDRNRFWNDERRARAKTLGLSPVEASTLASIVEEETNKIDERPIVARLYLNRLSRGMKLQADPTVKFALGDPTLRRITNVSIDSPYNTYKYPGLPPGPIRIVETTTIDQVLNAPEHEYLYMCAKEDFSGYHNFAVDGAAHQANARRYQAELDRRGIH